MSSNDTPGIRNNIGGKLVQGGQPANGQGLVYRSAQDQWRFEAAFTPPAIQQIIKAGDQTLVAPVAFTDVTGLSAVLPASGNALVIAVVNYEASAAGNVEMVFDVNGVDQTAKTFRCAAIGAPGLIMLILALACSGQTIKVQAMAAAGNITIYGTAARGSEMSVISG